MNIYIISFLFIFAYAMYKNQKSLKIFQIKQYNENNYYLKWVFKNFKTVFLSLDLLALIVMIISYVLNNKISKVLCIIAIIFYFLNLVNLINNNKTSDKNMILTKKARRLISTFGLLYLAPIVVYLIDKDNGILLVLIESILTYFSYFIVLLAKIINEPSERVIYKYYEIKAKEKLENMFNLKVIGITGSYGKTSSKTIIDSVLSNKYMVRSTPRSLNTEYGLITSINNALEKYDQIFIAELGAYKPGSIKKMVDLIEPRYAVLTQIGIAHLDSFKSPEDIKKDKFGLVEALPSDGVAVLNMDDANQVSYKIENECKKIWISINNKNADIRAVDIINNEHGSTFNVWLKKDNNKYPFETKLLGNYNIYNLLTSIALGLEIGMSISELQNAIKKVRSPKGRLELIDLDYMYQINDIYNSNPLGAKVALDVLNTMPGEKIVVTKGMTDLGPKEKEMNFMFGNQIADVADRVILIGSKKTRPIFDGMLEKGYDKDKIFIVNSVNGAYNLLQTFKFDKKIYALFESNYND